MKSWLTSRPMKSWLQDDDIEMYARHSERKSVFAERFIRALNNKIYKCRTSVSNHVHTYKLDDIVNKYNNKYYSTIKMNSVDLKSGIDIEFGIGKKDKDPKFKVGDCVGIRSYKNIFAKCHTPNWSDAALEVKKIKKALPCTYIIRDLNGEKTVVRSHEK